MINNNDAKAADKTATTEPKIAEKAPGVTPDFSKKVDANTVVGDTKSADSTRRDVTPEQKRL